MRALLSAVASATLLAVVAPTPASAAPHYDNAPTVHIGYTDLRAPNRAYDLSTSDVPVGTWRDTTGQWHLSRMFVTFDLSAYAGRTITEATLSLNESWAPDCQKRAIDVWQTQPISATPSWRNAPAEVKLLGSSRIVGSCPSRINLDLTAAVRGTTMLSLEIRVPAGHELDPAYGRKLAASGPVQLLVGYNAPPTVDTRWLYNNYRPCGDVFTSGSVRLDARGIDADGDWLTSFFEMWPVDQPSEVTALDGFLWVQVPSEHLTEGRTYAWRARISDGVDFSAWSRTCQFTIDNTRPAAPTVTAPNFDPVFGTLVGTTGTFTFGATDDDVVGFVYSWGEPSVPGCSVLPDGYVCDEPHTPNNATLTLPNGNDWGTLKVLAIDRAGNISDTTTLDIISVQFGPPGVVSDVFSVGVAGTFTFTPPEGATVVGYQYVLGDLSGEVTGNELVFTPTVAGTQTLSVAALLDTGLVSAARHYNFTVV